MKTMKKLFALLLAVLMVMGMATTAMADTAAYPLEGYYTITINNPVEGHVYKAYQIFTGALSSDGVLSTIQWGSAFPDDETRNDFIEALQADSIIDKYPGLKGDGTSNPFSGIPDYSSTDPGASADKVADVVAGGWVYNKSEIMAFADVLMAYLDKNAAFTQNAVTNPFNGKYEISVDKTGYYLIEDTWAGDAPDDGASDYLLLINRPNDGSNTNTVISPKISVPTFNKTVHTTLDGTYSKYVDSEISDSGLDTLERDTSNADKVKPEAMQKLSSSNAVWFKLESKLPDQFRNYHQYHLKFVDILPASLNPVEGSSQGNIYLLHESGEKVPLETSDILIENLNENKEPVADPNVQDKTVAYYRVTLDLGDIRTQGTIDLNKLNLNDTIVIKYAATLEPGAALNTAEGNENEATMIYSNDMNQRSPVGHAPDSDDHSWLKTGKLTSSASVYTYQATFTKIDSVTKAPLAGAKFYLYRNRTIGENTNTYYAKITDGYINDWTTDKDQATQLTSGNDGTFTVKGLDALTYHLEEFEAPVGYDKPKEAVQFTIEAPVDTVGKPTSLTMSVGGVRKTSDETNFANALVTGEVNNTKGNVLPETGGIGTTIFYIVGGVLVLGAGAAFVMKKRNEEA